MLDGGGNDGVLGAGGGEEWLNLFGYNQFSIFSSVNEVIQPGYMVDQLSKFPKERWQEIWRNIKSISNHFEFQYP